MKQMLLESGIKEYGPWMFVNGNCDVVRQLYDRHYFYDVSQIKLGGNVLISCTPALSWRYHLYIRRYRDTHCHLGWPNDFTDCRMDFIKTTSV